MSQSLLNEIKDQMKQPKYQIVSDTQKRLESLNLDDKVITEYLNWAYQNAIEDSGELNDDKYFKNLNRLPMMDEMPKVIKSLSIDEALNVLTDILHQQTSSLQEILVEYWYATLIHDDGYKSNVRILSKVRPAELADVLGTREGFDEDNEISIMLETDENVVILNEYQKEEALGELIEENDILKFHFGVEKVSMELHFKHMNTQIFHSIETVTNE